MGQASMDRAAALGVVRRAAEALRTAETKMEDTDAVSRALAAACGEMGLEPEVFDAFIAASPELDQLKTAAIREALIGSADPGPHAEISREAATGQPGDTTSGPGAPAAFTPASRPHPR